MTLNGREIVGGLRSSWPHDEENDFRWFVLCDAVRSLSLLDVTDDVVDRLSEILVSSLFVIISSS
jgi:hypothetical protein